MPDREIVIKGFEYCMGGCQVSCFKCPYREIGHQPPDCLDNCMILQDAVDLLKEQEPAPPKKVQRYIEYNETAVNFIDTYDCGNCGEELPDNAKYCPACGMAVKWDETD